VKPTWTARAWPIPLLLAALTRLGLPLQRHKFDGHEGDYLRVFLGEDLDASTRLYPVLAGFYSLLGQLSSEPALLVGVNLLAGIATVGLLGLAVGRRFGHAEGLAAATLLALSPTHAFWSASAYNVAIPHLFLVGALAAPRWWGLGLYAIGCTMRVELALLAPAMGLWNPRLIPGALGAAVCWPLMATGPEMRPLALVLPVNLRLTALMGPLGTWAGLVLVAAAAHRRGLLLLLAAGWVHLVGASFDDYGSRHALLGTLFLAAAISVAPGRRRWLLAPALALSLWGCGELRTWYYAPVEPYRALLPEVLEPPPDCTELMDDPLMEASHWNHRESFPADACWGEEAIHRSWTSRGLHDRALRMHTVYDPELIGVLDLPGGPRAMYRISR
jgi:hypothetical protein